MCMYMCVVLVCVVLLLLLCVDVCVCEKIEGEMSVRLPGRVDVFVLADSADNSFYCNAFFFIILCKFVEQW